MRPLTQATAALLKPLPIAPNDRIELSLDDKKEYFTALIFSQTPHGRGQPSHAALYKFLERVPERKELKGDRIPQWRLAATDYTASIISHVWPKEQVLFKDDESRGVYDYLNLTVSQQEICAENYATFKLHQEASLRARDMQMNKYLWAGYAPQLLQDVNGTEHLHPEFPLKLYQRVARRNIELSDGYGLFMEQGTGKTPVGVATVCDEAMKLFHSGDDNGRMYRAIIVCPNAVRLNWVKEFERFATCPGDVNVVRGNLVTRYEQFINAMVPSSLDSKFTVVVCGYETLRLTWELIEKFPWDLAMLDESHAIKWPETQRAKYSFKLRDISKKRVVLTGTPIANTPLDIYAQFEFMQKGRSGFASWKEFRTFYGVYAQADEDGHKKLVGLQNMPFMKERLARTSLIVTKKEVLPDLPEKTYDVMEVEMSDRQRDVYEQVSTQLALEIESDLEDAGPNKQLTINNVLTKLLRLAQITSGFVTYDKIFDIDGSVLQPSTTEFFSPNVKLDMLVEALKEKGPLDKTIVWSNWVPDLKAIKARLDLEGLDFELMYGQTKQADRDEAERRLNFDPKCRGLIANAAVAGAGLNFLGYPPHHPELADTNVSHHIIYAQDWSLIKRAQLEDRSHRTGTRVPQRYTDLVVPETVDEMIRARVVEKKASAMEITDIREILAAVLKKTK